MRQSELTDPGQTVYFRGYGDPCIGHGHLRRGSVVHVINRRPDESILVCASTNAGHPDLARQEMVWPEELSASPV
jgi:hypothetical protein